MKLFSCNLALVVLLHALAGCGGASAPVVENTADAQAKAKVDAFKKLAEGLSKDPNGLEAKAALEDFRNNSLNVAKNRKEAEEIVELYRSQVKGKYQGELM